MPILRCGDRAVLTGPNESVLDALLRSGVPIPHACRAGACQSCLVRAVDGPVPADAQSGLKATQRELGYFLACRAVPDGDLEVALEAESNHARATVASVERVAPDVARVRLAPREPLAYRPGQFVNVLRSDGLARSYSLASQPDTDAHLELYVREHSQGRMSSWLCNPETVGEPVELRGPLGECFYAAGRPGQPLLLAGVGTGIAPLFGIVRDALAREHEGPIRIFHGSRTRAGLFLDAELSELASRHNQVTYTGALLDGVADDRTDVGTIEDSIFRRCPDVAPHRVFICGSPEFVAALQIRLFLAGVRLADIASDAFVLAPPPA